MIDQRYILVFFMNDQTKEKLQKLLLSEKIKNGHLIMRVVSGLTRYRIIRILNANKSGLTVTNLANILKATPSRTSHQLSILRKFDLVIGNQNGRLTIYTLNHVKADPFLL